MLMTTLFIIVALFSLALFVYWLSMAYSVIGGGPYVGSKPTDVTEMVRLANVKPGDKAADLGSGDGRLIIALAQAGAEAHGYEVNPILVLWSRYKIWRSGLSGKAFIHWRNLWKESYRDFNIITLYTIFYVMNRMEIKLQNELAPGARVVCNTFLFPTWKPLKKNTSIAVYQKV